MAASVESRVRPESEVDVETRVRRWRDPAQTWAQILK